MLQYMRMCANIIVAIVVGLIIMEGTRTARVPDPASIVRDNVPASAPAIGYFCPTHRKGKSARRTRVPAPRVHFSEVGAVSWGKSRPMGTPGRGSMPIPTSGGKLICTPV